VGGVRQGIWGEGEALSHYSSHIGFAQRKKGTRKKGGAKENVEGGKNIQRTGRVFIKSYQSLSMIGRRWGKKKNRKVPGTMHQGGESTSSDETVRKRKLLLFLRASARKKNAQTKRREGGSKAVKDSGSSRRQMTSAGGVQ